jgi:hypothetical protein
MGAGEANILDEFAPDFRYVVEVVRDADGLEERFEELQDLSWHAAEVNASYDPWALIPALRHFGDSAEVVTVLVCRVGRHRTNNTEMRQLCGVFPMERRRPIRFIPALINEFWCYQDSVMCTPVLRENHTVPVVRALFDWLGRDPGGSVLLSMRRIRGDGPFADALAEVTYERGLATHVNHGLCRAVAVARDDPESYLRQAFSGRHLKEFRRKQRVLSQRGTLEWRSLARDDDVEAWLDMFVALEARGWKTAAGCAMALHADREANFRDVARRAFDADRLEIVGLFLDGQPLAMKCNLLSGRGAFAWKIAFNEDYSKFSPGMLLELHYLRMMHAEGRVDWMDFATYSDHEMSNRIALGRQRIITEVASSGRAAGNFLIALLGPIRWLHWTVRGTPARRSLAERQSQRAIAVRVAHRELSASEHGSG